MKRNLFVTLLLLICCSGFAQQKKDSLLSVLNKLPDTDTSKITVLLRLTMEYRHVNLDSAIYFSKRALALSFRSNDKTLLCRSYITLGVSYGKQDNFIEAIKCFQKANSLVPPKDQKKIAENINRIGLSYMGLGDFEKAEKSFNQYLKIAHQTKDSVLLSAAYKNLGVFYGTQGKMAPAVINLYKALKIEEQIGDSIEIADLYMNLGNVYNAQWNFEKSIDNNLKALDIYQRKNILTSQVMVYNNIGNNYSGMKNYPQAIHYFLKGVEVAKLTGVNRELAKIYTNLGSLYTEIRKMDSANYYLQLSIKMCIAKNDEEGLMYNYDHLAALFFANKDYNQSVFYGKKSLEVAMKLSILPYVASTANNLYLAYKGLNNSAAALYYHEIFKTYNDSVRSVNNTRLIEAERNNYAMESNNRKIELLQKENQLQAKENQLQKNYLIAIAIIALIVIGFSVIYYRQAKIKTKLNERLRLKNQENETQAIKLKALNQLKDKVIAVMSHDVKSPIASMYSVLELINLKQIKPDELPFILGQLSQSANNVSMLLENILGWVNSQMNQEKDVEIVKINLKEAAEEVLRLYKPVADQKYITLINFVPSDYTLHTNKNSLSLILRNLVSNAIKFSHETQIVELVARKENEIIHVSVKDSGVGMETAELQKLFNPLKLHTNLGTQQEKGTGLGLLFVKESIEHLGGVLNIKSEKNAGTTFIFSLPSRNLQPDNNKNEFAKLAEDKSFSAVG